MPVYLIEHKNYLGENGIYLEKDASSGGSDREAERFTFFARSSLEIFQALDWYPDIIHCQDWHVGMIPVVLKILARSDNRLAQIKTHLTIHNLEYQGWYNTNTIFKILGLSSNDYPTLAEQRSGRISSLEQAILACDSLNTVSPTYAQEILTPEYGVGLESDLLTRKNELIGILNGIDVEVFNPATDKNIAANYSSDDLSGKIKCKEELQKLCGFEVNSNIPLLGIVSRLASQKGINLISELADQLAQENLQLVLLGTGDPKLEKSMTEAAAKYPDKIHARIEFNAKFAQQIYAGSDIFLMPSRFEPCGLGQLISMRYGTIPLVRATGGLKDTVIDYQPANPKSNGFVFNDLTSQSFSQAIKRALDAYSNDKPAWAALVKSALSYDSSWTTAAKQYLQLYQKLLG